MRRYSIATRALLSSAAMLLLALVLMLPSGLQPVTQARSLNPQTAPTATAAPGSPALSPALLAQTTAAGNTVAYEFTIANVGGRPETFSVEVIPAPDQTLAGVTAGPNVTSITLNAGATQRFSVLVTTSTTTPAGRDVRRVRAIAQGDPTRVSEAVITTTVVVPTATATTTATPTRTSTPTGTAGPTATPGPVCADAAEPDNDPNSARELRPDVTFARVICPAGDQDWFFIGGLSGKVYTIDVPVMADGLDLSISVFDPAGNLVAFNDDFPRNNDATDIRPRVQSWRVPANARYTVRVRDAAGGGGTNLTYNIILISESYGPTPTLIAELCTDLFEPDGVPEQARLAVIREVQPNHRLCPSGDADWIRFFAKTGARYVLRTDSRSRAGVDTVMVLTDRDGVSILDVNDDFGNTLDSRIEFSPRVDGFYFVQVKNVGDIGSQFIAYDFFFEPLGLTQPTATVAAATATPARTTGTATPGTATPTGTRGTATATPTGGTPTRTPTPTVDCVEIDPNDPAYPICETALRNIDSPKGQPAFVNGPAREFIDPSFEQVWSRTDQAVATSKASRTWMWGPEGLVGRVEVYQQANGGARQVQYFDKARMEITDWTRDRANPWFVTNGLLVREMIEGKVQIGDAEFMDRQPADIGIAGDASDPEAPTYASLARLLERVPDRTGQTASLLLRRNGSTAAAAARPEARLAYYVPETGHNIAQVFWDFLQSRGPVGDGSREDVLIDWVFAMGYPIGEPYWTRVKVGGVEQDVLMQAFQRRVLTYTPSNPSGWQVEMGNVGRHYYQWRYGRQP